MECWHLTQSSLQHSLSLEVFAILVELQMLRTERRSIFREHWKRIRIIAACPLSFAELYSILSIELEHDG